MRDHLQFTQTSEEGQRDPITTASPTTTPGRFGDFVLARSTMILRAHVLKEIQLDVFETFDDGVGIV